MVIHRNITPQSDAEMLARGLGRVNRIAVYQQTHSSGSAFYDDGSGSGSGIVVGPPASSQGGIAHQDSQGNLSPVVDTKPIQDAVDQANKNIAANKTALADAQKTISQAESDADSAKKSADTAQQTANGLADDVSKATQTASNAQTAANDASSAASKAQSTADNASQAASDAKTAADNASKTANDAQSTANDANDKADAAQSVADDAHKTASNAMTTAANAQEQISDASGMADSALQAAEDAGSNAVIAKQNASDALKNANSALARATHITRDTSAPQNPVKGDVWYPVDSNKHVTGMKIWNGSAWDDVTIVAGKILVPGTVGATEIANGAITTPKIQAGAVQADQIAADAVSADKIGAGAVTADKLAADSVNAANIVANAITAEQIASDAVTSDKIAANAVTADKIAANSIDASKIKGQKLVGTQIQTSDNDPHMLLTQGTGANIELGDDSLVPYPGKVSNETIIDSTPQYGTLSFVQQGDKKGGLDFYQFRDPDSGNQIIGNGVSLGYWDPDSSGYQPRDGAPNAIEIRQDDHVGIFANADYFLCKTPKRKIESPADGAVIVTTTLDSGAVATAIPYAGITLYDRGSEPLSGSHHIYMSAENLQQGSVDVSDYVFLDVYYSSRNGTQGYTRVWNPQNGTKFVTQIVQEGGDGNLWAMTNTYQILNDSEMNVIPDGKGGWLGGQNPLGVGKSQMDSNPIYITHVEGWLD